MCSAKQAQHEAVSKSTRAHLQIAIFVLPTVVLAGWVTGADVAQWQIPFHFLNVPHSATNERSSHCQGCRWHASACLTCVCWIIGKTFTLDLDPLSVVILTLSGEHF